ncbi:MAG: aldehyde ferredoxin oxidoreductase family protein [Nitrososphaerota archaeon]
MLNSFCNGKILRVNLSLNKLIFEELNEGFYRTYLGGRGFGAYFLYKELLPHIDPFAPENKIIFATSIITGVPIPGVNRFSVISKSPLTNGFGEAEAGGYFANELKSSGFDAIIIEGTSEKPVYLSIIDGKAEIRDAEHLWGKTTKEVTEKVKKELKDPLIRVACIGPSGEKLVRFANIICDQRYAAGRSGLGAVMGSKKLKAIAVRGHKKFKFYDMKKLIEIARYFTTNWKNHIGSMSRHIYGTLDLLTVLNYDGTLPTLNFKGGSFEKADLISGEEMNKKILINREGCFACPIRCKRVVKGKEPYVTDPDYGGPEYETVAAFGSLCYIDDINAIALANQMCNAYGLDTISTGCAIAFAMECYENGILTKDDVNGLDLKFGNKEAMLKLIEMIAKRENIGDILAEGVMRASKKIGKGSEKFALHVKGKEVPMHEPRGKVGLALQYALSLSGADHMQCAHDPIFETERKDLKMIGIEKTILRTDLGPDKVKVFYYSNLWWSLLDCLGICKFTFTPHSAGVLTPNDLVNIVNAVTNWDTSLWELIKCSERAINIARCFNIREGLTSKDDIIPDRFFEEMEFGSRRGQKISRSDFFNARDLYYDMAGWDKEGKPRKAKLYELGLSWIIENM